MDFFLYTTSRVTRADVASYPVGTRGFFPGGGGW